MFDSKTSVVSVVAMLFIFLQHGIRAHSTTDSTSEGGSCSQMKEGWKFQVEENTRLRGELENERQRIKQLENVINAQTTEIRILKRENKRLQMRRKRGNTLINLTFVGV